MVSEVYASLRGWGKSCSIKEIGNPEISDGEQRFKNCLNSKMIIVSLSLKNLGQPSNKMQVVQVLRFLQDFKLEPKLVHRNHIRKCRLLFPA